MAKKKWAALTDAELEQQIRDAELRTKNSTEPRAKSVHYDKQLDQFSLELLTGEKFNVNRDRFPDLIAASFEQVREVIVTPGGIGLHWKALDVDYSVPKIIASMLGPTWKQEFARKAGQAVSKHKASVARQNGRKGGRPRKRTLAHA